MITDEDINICWVCHDHVTLPLIDNKKTDENKIYYLKCPSGHYIHKKCYCKLIITNFKDHLNPDYDLRYILEWLFNLNKFDFINDEGEGDGEYIDEEKYDYIKKSCSCWCSLNFFNNYKHSNYAIYKIVLGSYLKHYVTERYNYKLKNITEQILLKQLNDVLNFLKMIYDNYYKYNYIYRFDYNYMLYYYIYKTLTLKNKRQIRNLPPYNEIKYNQIIGFKDANDSYFYYINIDIKDYKFFNIKDGNDISNAIVQIGLTFVMGDEYIQYDESDEKNCKLVLSNIGLLDISYNSINLNKLDITILENLIFFIAKRTKFGMNENDVIYLNKCLLYIDLSHNKIQNIEKNLNNLENLINLRELDLSHNRITDIKVLKNLTNLIKLDISYNDVTEIKVLENLTNLKKLNISHNPIQAQELSVLENLTNLYSLDINSLRIYIENIENVYHLNLEKLKNLKEIKNDNYIYITKYSLYRNTLKKVGNSISRNVRRVENSISRSFRRYQPRIVPIDLDSQIRESNIPLYSDSQSDSQLRVPSMVVPDNPKNISNTRRNKPRGGKFFKKRNRYFKTKKNVLKRKKKTVKKRVN